MKKSFFIIFSVLLFTKSADAQQKYTDSLKHELLKAKEDTNKVKLYNELAQYYAWSYPDSAVLYAKPGLALAEKLNFISGQLSLLGSYSSFLAAKGNYAQGQAVNFKRLRIAEAIGDPYLKADALMSIGHGYRFAGDYKNALLYCNKARSIPGYFKKNEEMVTESLGRDFFNLNNLDSALIYMLKAYKLHGQRAVPCIYLGKIYEKKGDHKKAINFTRQAIKLSYLNAKNDLVEAYTDLAAMYKSAGSTDSSIYYAKKALNITLKASLLDNLLSESKLLTDLYKSKHLADSALKYEDMMLATKDSQFSKEKITQMVYLL